MISPEVPYVEQNRAKSYVVYWGVGDANGVYGTWQGAAGATGAKEATDGMRDAIFRRIESATWAEAAYEECRVTGVLAALKPKMPRENFIVVKGEFPGVYTRQ